MLLTLVHPLSGEELGLDVFSITALSRAGDWRILDGTAWFLKIQARS